MTHVIAAGGLGDARSFDFLATVERWTAQLALELLPETNQPRVEVFRGRVIVSPYANINHQRVGTELVVRMNGPVRAAGMRVLFGCNVVSGDDLFIPDVVVVRGDPRDRVSVDISEAVLLGEITSPGNRNKDLIDRKAEYAAGGVPFYLLVEMPKVGPRLTLHGLTDGAYHEAARAGSGATFRMTEPFPLEFDPADLLD